MTPSQITWLHVESTNRCNAWCPACPRNDRGFGLSKFVTKEVDLDLQRFSEVVHELPNLQTVQFCGNYGDPVIGQNFLDLIDFCVLKNLKIQIHTNGSLRNISWWADLGKKLSNHPHDVWFGIDGIGEVHEIYRQATSYDKIIENASAFIAAGGYATWQFIPYEHNQHQVKQALVTSQQLKFKKFKMVTLFRNKKTVRHWKTGETFELKPPSKFIQMIKMPGKKLPPSETDCMHMSPEPSVYLNAHGKLSWCCYRTDVSVGSVNLLLEKTLQLSNKNCIINCGKKEKV